MPQGRDIGEAGAKSVALVTIAGDGAITVEERLTSVAQFEEVEVDLSGLTEWRDVALYMGRALERARAAARSEQLIARLTLTGETPLAWQVRRDGEVARAEAEQRAENVGRCWIDKIEIACEMPRVGADADSTSCRSCASSLTMRSSALRVSRRSSSASSTSSRVSCQPTCATAFFPRGQEGRRVGVDALSGRAHRTSWPDCRPRDMSKKGRTITRKSRPTDAPAPT